MALLRYALRDDETPFLAIVSDDSGAEYVYSTGEVEEISLDERANEIPTDQLGWADLAASTYRGVPFSPDETPSNRNRGRAQAIKTLVSYELSEDNPVSLQAARALDETSQSYPAVVPYSEQDEEYEDPQAMTHLVLEMLGPIDPEGRYGWILREMDGEARPEDAESYLSFGQVPDESAREENKSED